MIALQVTYNVKPGKRDEFYNKVCELGIADSSRGEQGNLGYAYFVPVEGGEDKLLLLENWRDRSALDAHAQTPWFKRLQTLKAEYVDGVDIVRLSPAE